MSTLTVELGRQLPSVGADGAGWRLRPQVFFRETPTGVFFDAGAQAFELKGRGLYPLVQRVLHFMDAGHDEAAIRAKLPPALQGWLTQFLAALQEHRMLVDARDEEAWLAGLRRADGIREFVHYLQDRLPADDLRSALAPWRATHACLSGAGYAFKAGVQALLATGIGRLSLCVDEAPSRVTVQELGHMVEAWPDTQVHWVPSPVAAPLLLQLRDAVALPPGPRPSSALMAWAGALHGQTLAWADAADAARCGPDLAATLATRQDAAPSPASLAIAGTLAVQALLQHHFGLAHGAPGPAVDRRVWSVSDVLDVSRHAVLPSPASFQAAVVAPGSLGPEAAGASEATATDDTLRQALNDWFDPCTGVFAPVDVEGLVQLPLYHEALSLRGHASPLVGWGLDAHGAWRRAVAQGLETWVGGRGGPVCCAFDERTWRGQSLARAVLAHPAWAALRRCSEQSLGDVGDGPADLLLRLLRQLTTAPLSVRLHWHPDWPAAQLWLAAGPTWLAEAQAATPLLALREALGLGCSALQRGLGERPGPTDGGLPQAPMPDWRAPRPAAAAGVTWTRLTAPSLPDAVWLGRAQLEALA